MICFTDENNTVNLKIPENIFNLERHLSGLPDDQSRALKRWIVDQGGLSESQKREAVREFCTIFLTVQKHIDELKCTMAWLKKYEITEQFAESRLKNLNAQEKVLNSNFEQVRKSLEHLFDMHKTMHECKTRIDMLLHHPKCTNTCRIHCNSSKPKKVFALPRGRPNNKEQAKKRKKPTPKKSK